LKQVDPQPHWPEDIKKGRVRDPLTAFLNAPAIARVRQDRELLSDREYCELVVAFANDGALPMESWLALLGGARRAPTSRITSGLTQLVRDQLSQLVQHREAASAALGPYWAEEVVQRGLVTLPVCTIGEDGAITLRHRILTLDALGAVAYAMCLLLDPRRTHGSALWRCRLESCKRFFFEQASDGAGRPRREYCGPDHLEQAHRENVRERVQATRAGVPVERWREMNAEERAQAKERAKRRKR
jgi:hypothetical protein